MDGLARVATALNADDQCLARIAAVHMEIPDLPGPTARQALAAEDSLIKLARNRGSTDAIWNPALHPRTGTPPNPGWFATTEGTGDKTISEASSHSETTLPLAENHDDSHRIDVPPTNVEIEGRPAGDTLWSNISSVSLNWLQELAPEYDLESGQVVGERPRWRAIAPYVAIPAAIAAIFGGEALASAVPSILGSGGSETAVIGLTERVTQIHGVLDPLPKACARLPFWKQI